MIRATSDQVRNLQLELLNKFRIFCEENCIQYFAFAGTLLGAVRHKGFIPWDNDVDLAVSRSDYLRMQEILKNENANEHFRFLCYENDHNYLWQHGRIVAKGTYMKTARGYDKLGLSIDIFPLDNQGNDRNAAAQNLKEIKKCVRLRIMSYDKKYKNSFMYPQCPDDEKEELRQLFETQGLDDEEYWVKRHIALAQKFSDETDSFYYGCNSNDKYTVVCERSLYDGVVYLDFENTKIPAPGGFAEILRRYYGDFMKLPSKEKQTELKNMQIYLL